MRSMDPEPADLVGVSAPPRTELRVADMDPIEEQYCRAMHDLDCGGQGEGHRPPSQVDHELEAHEPWSGSDLEGEVSWPALVRALRERGLILAEIDSNERDENPYIRGYNRGWDDALANDQLPDFEYEARPLLDPDPRYVPEDARPEADEALASARALALVIVVLMAAVFIITIALVWDRP